MSTPKPNFFKSSLFHGNARFNKSRFQPVPVWVLFVSAGMIKSCTLGVNRCIPKPSKSSVLPLNLPLPYYLPSQFKRREMLHMIHQNCFKGWVFFFFSFLFLKSVDSVFFTLRLFSFPMSPDCFSRWYELVHCWYQKPNSSYIKKVLRQIKQIVFKGTLRSRVK